VGSPIASQPAGHLSQGWPALNLAAIQTSSPIWLAYVRLEDPRGLSPITTLGRFDTVDEAQIATDECGHPDETLALLSRQLNPCPALGPTDRARSSQLMGPC
jgi:hypothetical protein